jgi:DNA-binding transcriptional LysR family regulator
MELRDIEYFAVVADHGHLGRAAEYLGLSQSALSKSLRRLEQAMGAKLVKRTPKGVELTAEGSALLLRVRGLRLSLQDVTREIADLSKGRVGYLRIGAGPIIAEHMLPAAFITMLKDAPQLRLKITINDNDVMVPELRNGKLELIVIFIPPSPYEGLVQDHLYDDEWVVFASADHRLARLKRVSMADLAQEQWVLSSPDRLILYQERLHRVFQDSGLPPPRIAVETRSLQLRLQTVASSTFLGFTSRRVLQRAAPQLRLTALPVKELAWRRPVGVIYRKDAYLSPAAKRFIEILKTTAKEIAAEKP